VRIVIATVLGVFVYSVFANVASRLFNRFDPSSKYSDRRYYGGIFESDQQMHQTYIFIGSILWPVSLTIWTIFRLPYHIALRVERYLDKPKIHKGPEAGAHRSGDGQ